MTAQYYTYRNLNFGEHFSTKHKGRVIDYFENAHIRNGSFRVSEAGRKRCLNSKRRNVHAFVVSAHAPNERHPQAILLPQHIGPGKVLREVKYNPYVASTFFLADTKEPIEHADDIYLIGGRAYVI